jgi:hypothetical protein
MLLNSDKAGGDRRRDHAIINMLLLSATGELVIQLKLLLLLLLQ